MSKKPPSSRIPSNLAGQAFFEILQMKIGSWCPLPNGKGPATQVHIQIHVDGVRYPLLVRFKTPDALDRFIDTLKHHRYDVWPTPGAPNADDAR